MKDRLIRYSRGWVAGLVTVGLAAGQVAAHDLYWTEEEVIMASDIDGENVTEVFDGTGMGGYAVDILVTDDHLYWTDHADSGTEGGIWRANLDGSDAELFVENDGSFSAPHYLVLSEVHGKIYFSCYSNGLLQADLDTGGNVEVLFDDFPGSAAYTGVALRGENDEELVWITASGNAIYRTQLPSGNTPQGDVIVDVSGAGETYGLAYNPEIDAVFFTNFGSGTLHRLDFDTEEATLLREGLVEALGIQFSPSYSHLLIAERDTGVSAYQLDNFGYELIAEASDAHFGVAVTADPADLPDGPGPPQPPKDGDMFFQANFEDDEVGEAPRSLGQGGVWTAVEEGSHGPIEVVQDTDDEFGYGSENQFVRFENVRGGSLDFSLPPEVEVATLSFDLIDRPLTEDKVDEGDPERGGLFLFQDGARIHQYSMVNGTIRGQSAAYPAPDQRVRKDLVVNNSLEAVTYEHPVTEEEHTVAAESIDLWVDGMLTLADYTYTREDDVEGEIELLRVGSLFSTDTYSMDLDNITLFKGAYPFEPIVEGFEPEIPQIPYAEEPELVMHDDFNHADPGELTPENADDYEGPFRVSFHSNAAGTVRIATDDDNLFGRGTDNRILHLDEAFGFNFSSADDEFESGVMTVAFDMHHEGDLVEDETNSVLARFFHGGVGTGQAHRFQFVDEDIDGGSYRLIGISRDFHGGYTQRFGMITNTTTETIEYDSPNGPQELPAGESVVWVNGYRFDDPYIYAQDSDIGAIRSFRFQTFSSQVWNAYFDNFRIWEGAIVPDADVPARDEEPEPRDLVVYEGFDYDAGTLLTNDGGIGWAEGYEPFGDADSADVTSPGLDFGNLPVTGNKVTASDGDRNFRTIAVDGIHSDLLNPYADHIGRPGTSVWVSALIQAVDPVGNPFMGFGFYRDTVEQSGETIFIGKATHDEDRPFEFGEGGWRVQGGAGGSKNVDEASLFTGVPYTDLSFFALRIDYREDGNDRIYVFHNPDPEGDTPSTGEALGYIETDVGSFGFDRMRIAGNDNGFHLDELRIGTSWHAVSGQDAPEPPAGYEDWRTDNFTEDQQADDSISGPGADPAGDGVANILKYALGLDPFVPAAGADLPREEMREIDGVEYLTLTFTRPNDRDDIDYTVQGSGDLATWPDGAVRVDELTEDHGDGTTTYVYRDVQPLGDSDRRFLRLNVGFAD